MKEALLFSYAILPKQLYKPKEFKHNDSLHPDFSLTAVSAFETYAGYLIARQEQVERVVIMGCRTFGEDTPADSELMARYLHKLGMSNDKIVIDEYGFNFASQVERAKHLISDDTELFAVTLESHSRRAELLLKAYGLNPRMVTVENIFQKETIPQDLRKYFEVFTGGEIKPKLEAESRILLLLQSIDPRGYLQLLITKLRGIRYFDVDIPPTLAKPIILK